jgi:hypothetical protein
METYSRIGLLRSYGNLQSYWTTTKLWKLTVVFYVYLLVVLLHISLYLPKAETEPRERVVLAFDSKKTTLETSGKHQKLHSKRVEKVQNLTRNECSFLRFYALSEEEQDLVRCGEMNLYPDPKYSFYSSRGQNGSSEKYDVVPVSFRG